MKKLLSFIVLLFVFACKQKSKYMCYCDIYYTHRLNYLPHSELSSSKEFDDVTKDEAADKCNEFRGVYTAKVADTLNYIKKNWGDTAAAIDCYSNEIDYGQK